VSEYDAAADSRDSYELAIAEMRKRSVAKRVEQIGDATLYLGDCLEILPTLGKVDAVVTDPPYSSGARTDSERQVRGAMLRSMEDADWFSHDAMTTWGFGWFVRSLFTALRDHLSVGAHIYACIDWRQTPNLYGMLEACGYRVNHCLVWKKPHFGMGAYWRNQHENIVFASLGMPSAMLDRGRGSVLEHSNVPPMERQHPTEKPVSLLLEIIDAIPAATVFDPFMGSGSTGVAAARAGRRFFGVEINPHHFDIACRRIEQAYSQPDMFIEPPAKPKQEAML
jgi:site-specific DNA-methyltransferase (adenine-specific)